jgi:hypothetical protein
VPFDRRSFAAGRLDDRLADVSPDQVEHVQCERTFREVQLPLISLYAVKFLDVSDRPPKFTSQVD